MSNVMRATYRELTSEEKDHMAEVKSLALQLYEFVDSLGGSRELALAKTKTEEAVMWATKHITGEKT